MKILFNRNNSIGIFCLLLLLAVGAVSCIKDEYAESKETATVTMTFTTRAVSNPLQGESTLLDNEQMKTLRVIVARYDNDTKTSGEIMFNVSYDIDPNEKQKKVTFSELTVKKEGEYFAFYAIANEEAFLDAGESLEGKNIDLAALLGKVLNKSFNRPTPLALVPQAGFKVLKVGPNESKTAFMQLQFPVGKVQLIFNNQTKKEVTLEDVKIASVVSNQGFLFKDAGLNEGFPANTTQSGTVYFDTPGENWGTVVVPATPTADVSPFVRYLYPSEAGAGKYILTAKWNGKEKTVPLKLNGAEEGISAISYGQQYNIHITLLANSLKVKLEVLPWSVDETEIDYSTEFTAWLRPQIETDMKLVDTDDGQAVAVATAGDGKKREAVFSFKMTSPEGARWTAHLENTTDFELQGTSYGYGGKEAGETVFSVVPLHEYNAQNPQTVQLYITVSSSFGEAEDEGVQIINPLENGIRRFPGTETKIVIRQVGETAFDQLTEMVFKD